MLLVKETRKTVTLSEVEMLSFNSNRSRIEQF
jgi:hypothetical protein